MKRLIPITLIMVFCLPWNALASDAAAILSGQQLVVDRTTRSKMLNDYALLTRDAIQRVWKTPLDLEIASALKGRVRINYSIRNDGSLAQLQLVKGSGHVKMDRSLLKAIRSAAPFPRFPDEVNAGSILIRANFIVADLPTVPPTTVSQPVAAAPANTSSAPAKPGKKYIWGVPAGTAERKKAAESVTAPDPVPDGIVVPQGKQVPPRFPSKKYQWGTR
jgi:TonB family protein